METVILPEKPEELRPILRKKIEELDAHGLTVVHRALLQLEAERLANEIVAGLAKDGDFFDRIEEGIIEHRKKHPYK